MKRIFSVAAVSLLAGLALSACKKSGSGGISAEITHDYAATNKVAWSGEQITLRITSDNDDATWVLSSEADWLSFSPRQSWGNKTVKMTVAPNPIDQDRTATVRFYVEENGSIEQTFTVTQAAKDPDIHNPEITGTFSSKLVYVHMGWGIVPAMYLKLPVFEDGVLKVVCEGSGAHTFLCEREPGYKNSPDGSYEVEPADDGGAYAMVVQEGRGGGINQFNVPEGRNEDGTPMLFSKAGDVPPDLYDPTTERTLKIRLSGAPNKYYWLVWTIQSNLAQFTEDGNFDIGIKVDFWAGVDDEPNP
ncbi:MAG: BACON domain-containing protein [Rikenellaceae bacterium]|jgi:hypothetical protein|nr:BACON domain-containing protein [Rikenellaceae bacterium]